MRPALKAQPASLWQAGYERGRDDAAKVADEFEADRNGRAYDKRQQGQDDSFHAACASAASCIATAIRALTPPEMT